VKEIVLGIEYKKVYSQVEDLQKGAPSRTPFILKLARLFIPTSSPSYSFCALIGAGALLLNACVAAETEGSVEDSPDSGKSGVGALNIHVQVLSTGRGVPDATMRTYREIKALVMRYNDSGTDAVITEQVLGLEGERRMCVVLTNAKQADALYGEISELAHEMKLMRVSSESCE
jgi:hypothetical protein